MSKKKPVMLSHRDIIKIIALIGDDEKLSEAKSELVKARNTLTPIQRAVLGLKT